MKAVIVFCLMALSIVDAAWKPLPENLKEDLIVYQVYPRSFKDSNGDGIGDIEGIKEKLDHFLEMGVDMFWLSPIYPSPMVDFGYDISNYTDVHPIFGTISDLDNLVSAAHEKGLKIILDFVPNHTSDQHEWFQLSLKNIEPYNNYYIWHPGKIVNGKRVPPTNWVGVFGGSAWSWREERQAYYLHQFAPEQPDLNYYNPVVLDDMQNVLRFWLRRGFDGFRVDALPYICEDMRFLDEPLSGETNDPNKTEYTLKIYTHDIPETYNVVRKFRDVLDEFPQPKHMLIEAYTNLSMTMKYYDYGADFPFNFAFIKNVSRDSNSSDFKKLVDNWMTYMPPSGIPNWVPGNHDQLRLVSRFGEEKARMITTMSLLLPGVAVNYYGDEIGMSDTYISWEDTQDPQGCGAGKENYQTMSRDPARTPFQWDDSVSAGFSSSSNTWLRVNENYKTVNLAAEKKDKNSFFNMFKKFASLKKSPYFKEANLNTRMLNDNVFAFSRETEDNGSLYAILNFSNEEQIVDLKAFNNVPKKLNMFYNNFNSDIKSISNNEQVKVSALGFFILISQDAKFGNF
ncbi:alpha-glucosidase precursor [Apis mellifera]|uniref:Alpha-glucosidase n=1 Tax=Apis mellifera TaxID=7460 RepID=MAL1_APIME|nr:alpha-glucosidase precursor [Apis mellifera]Q17058.1 RecName: Full=Alpha-glucosidase; AltName: Full=Maltase; Flags: Precursor [Apis mellifera]BAA11466.1 alpha-glucosidase [Apis mellifera]|eukprot:NP_001011608.1 alpha-glucosidase precursor [Apis mellifera]